MEGPLRYDLEGYRWERRPGASPSAPLPDANAPAPNVIVYPARPTKQPATFQEMGFHGHKFHK